MNKIAILGCGWLGLPLAVYLQKNGFEVRGSTTSADKLNTLRAQKIRPYLITLGENEVGGDVSQFLAEIDCLIIGVPPKVRSGSDYAQKIKILMPHVEQAGAKHIIFISSTSVYRDENLVVNEETRLSSDTIAAKNLIESEELIRRNDNFKSTIIRFGGLIGGDRHPVKFLSGRYLENCDAPINLIQQSDCIGIISTIIDKEIWNETFNAVAP